VGGLEKKQGEGDFAGRRKRNLPLHQFVVEERKKGKPSGKQPFKIKKGKLVQRGSGKKGKKTTL